MFATAFAFAPGVVAASVFDAVTIASTVPDSTIPAVMIDVADVITVSRAAAAVTVIVNVCATAPCSAPDRPIVAGVSFTTYVPAFAGAVSESFPTKTLNLAEAATVPVPAAHTATAVFGAVIEPTGFALLSLYQCEQKMFLKVTGMEVLLNQLDLIPMKQ
jgi:hypothetical protein